MVDYMRVVLFGSFLFLSVGVSLGRVQTNIVQRLQERQLECITFPQFRDWCHGPDGEQREEKPVATKDPFGNSSLVPDRFSDVAQWTSSIKAQHPCFTTTAHDLGARKPQQVDMPVKWRGKQGEFTRDFEMNEPGKSTITVNNYRCTPTCTVPMAQYDTPFVRPKHIVVIE
jgi:hypothetical protein